MAVHGKTWAKSKMRDLMAHYGSHRKIASLIGVTAPTIRNIEDGGTTYKPTRDKLDTLVKKVRAKKKEKESGATTETGGKFAQLTARDAEIIGNLHGKYGAESYKKLGVSKAGMKLLVKRSVGDNVMKGTKGKIEKANARWLKDVKIDNVETNSNGKPKGWLLKAIMEQQRAEASPMVDVSQDVTNALVVQMAKINTMLENQEKMLDQQVSILNQQNALYNLQQTLNTAWLT